MKKSDKKDYVNKVVNDLHKKFLLAEWQSEVIFADCDTDKEVGYKEYANNSVSIDYLEYTITVRPHLLEQPKQVIKKCLIHELSHVLTEPLYLIAIDGVTNTQVKYLETVREQQTQRISKIIDNLL